ncbi:MAG: DHA2 family efflux MFS transporter permease subunit [Bdellovibrionota bacterium]
MIKSLEHRWQILFVAMIGTFMAALDSSIVNVSIPVLISKFNSSVHEVSWVVTAYMISFAVFMPLTAWLKDRIGNKKLYIYSLGIFTLGSLLCGMAPTLSFLTIARVIQAIGGGALTPTAMSLVAETFDSSERGKALGYWGLGVVVGPALGPTIGGLLTEYLSWRWIFLVNIPVGIIGVLMSQKVLVKAPPRSTHPHRPMDWPGFILLGTFLSLFLYAVTMVENQATTASALGLYFGASAFLLFLFVFVERKSHHPMIELGIFKNKVFTACAFLTAARSASLFGGVFLLPILLHDVFGYSETQIGLILLPGSAIIAIMMPISGKFSDKSGARLTTWLGLILLSASMIAVSFARPAHSLLDVSLALILRGFGLGLLISPIIAVTINSVSKEKVALASTLSSLIQQVGGAIGVATLATFYEWKMSSNVQLLNAETKTLSLLSLQHAFLLGSSMTLLALVPSFFLPKKRVQTTLPVSDQEIAASLH